MSNSSGIPWSNDSNAPWISSNQYRAERAFFTGTFLGAVLYGIAIVVFFRCMITLLDPVGRVGKDIKWGSVAHTVAMFLVLTISTVLGLEMKSMAYVDNRDFHGGDEALPGPLGYYDRILSFKAISAAFSIALPLNQWLADGLLLYRCYIIYSKNHWVMAFPRLLYLASIALGVAFACLATQPNITDALSRRFSVSYYSISLSLNAILTLMIVARLILHRRNARKSIGVADRAGELFTAVIAMLIESCALYSLTFLLLCLSWVAGDRGSEIFAGILGATQVIAPYLITLRVARRQALENDVAVSESGSAKSIRFRDQRTEDSDKTLPNGGLGTSMVVNGGIPAPSAGVGGKTLESGEVQNDP